MTRPRPDPVYLATLDLVGEATHRLYALGFEVAATPTVGALVLYDEIAAVVWWTGDLLGDWAALEGLGWVLCAEPPDIESDHH